MVIYTSKPDSSFIQNEVLAFATLGEDVIVFYEVDRPIPETIVDKAQFIRLSEPDDSLRLAYLFRHFIQVFVILTSTPMADFKRAFTHGKLSTLFIMIQNGLIKFHGLSPEQKNQIQKDGKLLSFWFYDVMFPLILKKKGVIKRFFARAHRGDTYEGELGVNLLLFRNLFLKETEMLFPISDDGADFIHNKYPRFSEKIKPIYLGSFRYYNEVSANSSTDKCCIVSCAWINNKKRIHHIPEILATLDIPFEWHHFGSGNHEHESLLNTAIANAGIEQHVTLHGNTPNRDIQAFYYENQPDCFLSISSTEGVPVSFMEALSYGIPVVATSVGGNAEIIDQQTGELLELDAPPTAFSDAIKRVSKKYASTDSKLSLKSIWNERFSIVANAKKIQSAMKA